LFIYSVVSVNRNIVRYNKYIVHCSCSFCQLSYCYSYCDFVRTFYIRYWCVQVEVRVPYFILFF